MTFFSDVVQDVMYARRMLRKSLVFTWVAVLTLALGIGPTTAIFGLIDAVLLRSLPVENPSQLMLLKWTAHQAPNTDFYWSQGDCAVDSVSGASGCSFSEPMFRQIERSNAFAGASAFASAGQLNLTGNGPATLVNGQFVSGDFFQTTGVKGALGRVVFASDDAASATPVAVLSYGYWQSSFGGKPDVIGRTIMLNRATFTIIGVAEQGFRGLSPGSDYDVWLPLSAGELISTADMPWNNRQVDVAFWWLTLVGRLKPGTQPTIAQAQVSVLFNNQTMHGPLPLFQNAESNAPPAPGGSWGSVPSATPEARADRSGLTPPAQTGDPEILLVSASAGLTGQRGRYSDSLYVLMLAVGIILLIACANVAGLSLARANARKSEIAVRLTLGASRPRILRQLLTESVLLSVLGGVLGMLFAYWGERAIISFVSNNQAQPLGFAAGVDLRVLGFTFGVSLLTGILFGIAPALRSIRADLAPSLKDAGRGARNSGDPRRKWFSVGNGLVVGQVVLAVVLLIGAGLLVRTLLNLRRVDVGFDPWNVVIFKADPALAGYGAAEARSLYSDVQHRLAAIPGVNAISYSFTPPLTGGVMAAALHWPGTPKDQQSIVDMLPVGPEFFVTLRIPLLSGRSFSQGDFERSAANGNNPTSAPTPVIVNQAFVRRFLQNENPLGKLFGQSEADANGPANPGYEIIGVVRDAKYGNLRQEIQPTMYGPQSHGNAWFELRTLTNPRALLPAIRDAVSEVSPNLPLFDVRTLSDQADRLLFRERLMAWLSELLGVLALVLAAVGLYGLLSFEVSRRTHEIGVRMALGAEAGSVLRLIAGRGTLIAVVGVSIGVAAALGATRAIGGVLYGVRGNDPATFVVISVLLMLVALAASWFPARRATRTDPMQALRYE
jgi:predicted permease